MKPKKQRSSLVISSLHSTLHTFILENRLPKGISPVLWLLGTNFKEMEKNQRENCLPKLFPGFLLESSVPLHFYFLSFTRQQTPNWIPGCCGCHECPSISREWPWCRLTLLLFQPGHSTGWSPHTYPLRVISCEDTKYQHGCTGSNPPPITHVISPLPLCSFNSQINLSTIKLAEYRMTFWHYPVNGH